MKQKKNMTKAIQVIYNKNTWIIPYNVIYTNQFIFTTMTHVNITSKLVCWGGTRIWFGKRGATRALKPLPFSKGHFCQKRYPFLRIFLEIEAYFSNFSGVRIYFGNFGWQTPNILNILEKWTHVYGFFFWKSRPMSKDFLWKKDPFGRHIPV